MLGQAVSQNVVENNFKETRVLGVYVELVLEPQINSSWVQWVWLQVLTPKTSVVVTL